jgi:hypothetical protein
LRLGVWQIEQVIGVGFSPSAALFFDQAGVEQFGKCPSELSVISVSESRVEALGLETTFPSQVSQREREGFGLLSLSQVEEAGIEFECLRAEVLQGVEVYKGHARPFR